jgi:sec-independent protein translocase protein TatA
MGRGLFEGWHLIILIVLLIVLFGFRRLPDAARSIGRSMRIFKSEVDEMKNDGKSAASSDTVRGEAVREPRETPRETPGQQTTSQTSQPVPPTPGASREGDALREDNSPRTDNHSGPVA